jgi:Coenzyme PQQ synthesis protein D (PqqD)
MTSTLSWRDVEARKVRLPAHVVSRAMATETVLLNIQSGQYHAVDAVGGRFLESLARADDVAGAAQSLATEYDEPLDRVQDDLLGFLDALRQRGLLELA